MNKKPTFTTAIEWHDAKTDPPKKSSLSLLVVTSGGYITDIPYSKKHNRFNFYDYMSPEKPNNFDAVFWAEIPKQFTWDALAPYRDGDGA